jgi:predicted amidohydrolase
MLRPYALTCAQTNVRVIADPTSRDEVIRENLARSLEIAEEAIEADEARLILFPEGWLQGFNASWPAEAWQRVGLRIPGPETDLLAERAARHGVYFAGAAWEVDPDWPGRYFNTAFVVSPEGEVVLKYRQLNPETLNGLSTATSPADVYEEYVARHGLDALFPVADTPLGHLACLIGNDVNFLEVARILTWRGAEVLLMPTGEPHGADREAWENARRTRAYESLAYLASANHGSVTGSRLPAFRSRGHSEIVDYQGRVLAVADAPGETLISGTLDLNALRQRRTQVALNFPAQTKSAMFASVYAAADALPKDHWRDRPIRDRREGPALVDSVIARFQERGIFERPTACE